MIKILTTGCSFTHDPNSWANYLKDQYDLTNVAEGGGGNEMNLRNASLELLTYPYTHIIAQISGINRFEIIIDEKLDKTFLDYNKLQYDKREVDGLSKAKVISKVHLVNNNILPKETYTWIKSTGDQRWWRGIQENNFNIFRTSKQISDRLNAYVKYCHSDIQQIIRTLIGIVNLQKICEINNVKSLFFCWRNEFEQYEKQIQNSAELTNWWDQIDWTKFWFHGKYGGLSEWGIANNFTGALHEDKTNVPAKGWRDEDGQKIMIGHPSTECHWAFAKKIINPWIEQDA